MAQRLQRGELRAISRNYEDWVSQSPTVLPHAALQFKATKEARQQARETRMDTQIPMVLPDKILENQEIPEYAVGSGFTHNDFDCLVTEKSSDVDWLGKVWLGEDDFMVVRQRPASRQIVRHQPQNVYYIRGYVDSRARAGLEALESSIRYVR